MELGFELLAKQPEDRPETARVVAERLQEMIADLVAAEGLIDLVEHMDDALGDRKQAERDKLAEQLRALEATPVEAKPTGPPPAPARGRLLPFAIAALLFGGGVGALVLLNAREADEPARAAPSTVVLTIDSEPSGAAVRIDGEPAGSTPTKASLTRGSTAVALSITKDGFKPVERSFVPESDQVMHVSLTREATPTASSSTTPTAKPSPPRFGRPRPKPAPTAAPTSSAGLFRRFD